MVHGSTVHGIGAALLEEFRYDEAGQPHLGVVVRSLPITPEQVWRWLRAGSG